MENDVLRNKIAPWQEKGRWYHAHLTENGLDTLHSDKFINDNFTISSISTAITLNNTDYTIIDFKYRINKSTIIANTSISLNKVVMTNGREYVNFIRCDAFSVFDCDIYIFICDNK